MEKNENRANQLNQKKNNDVVLRKVSFLISSLLKIKNNVWLRCIWYNQSATTNLHLLIKICWGIVQSSFMKRKTRGKKNVSCKNYIKIYPKVLMHTQRFFLPAPSCGIFGRLENKTAASSPGASCL